MSYQRGELQLLMRRLELSGGKFVQDYGSIVQPDRSAEENKYQWNEEAQHGFESLKAVMKNIPVPAMPDFNSCL